MSISKVLENHAEDVPSTVYEQSRKEEAEKLNNILNVMVTENAYVLHKELGEWMTDNVTVVRENEKLLKTDAKIEELMER